MLADYRQGKPIKVTREDGFEAWFRPDWSYESTLRRARGQFNQPIPDERNAKQKLLAALVGTRKLARKTFKDLFTYDMWAIGYCNHHLQSLDELHRLRWTWLPEPAERTYHADPFAYRAADGWHVLAERHTHGQPATIVDVTADKTLLTGCHHSYPYLFTYENQTYMLPETVADRELRLYPLGTLKPITLLQDTVAADPVLFEHHGRWWLLYTGTSQHGAYHLHALYADTPFGPFQRHQKDPLKQDIRSARNGGKPFRLNQNLYRPAQVCSQSYGQALVIHQITELTPTTFHEVAVMKLEPKPPYPDGLHHLVVEEGLILIDGKRLVTDLLFPLRRDQGV